MALRTVLGIRPDGASQESETALSGATKDHPGSHCDPTPSQPAAIPRPSPRTGKVLGHVPAIPAGAPGANVQARCAEISRDRRRTAAGSHRHRKRRLVRGFGLLPDAYSGEFIVRAELLDTNGVLRIQELGARL